MSDVPVPRLERPVSATWPGHRSAKETKQTRVGAVRLALGLSRLSMSLLLGLTERTVHRAETGLAWRPRGLSRLALEILEERIAAGETAELQQIARLAEADLDAALRLLFMTNNKRKGRG